MSVVREIEVVVARIEDVAALARIGRLIIRGQSSSLVVKVSVSLALPPFSSKEVLSKETSETLDFFDSAFDIRDLAIDLHDIFASVINAGIGDFHLEGEGIIGEGWSAFEGLGERGIGRAIAKGVLHHLAIATLAGPIASIIGRFVPFVADVNALAVIAPAAFVFVVGRAFVDDVIVFVGAIESRTGGQIIGVGVPPNGQTESRCH
jgi:hypothetical protein